MDIPGKYIIFNIFKHINLFFIGPGKYLGTQLPKNYYSSPAFKMGLKKDQQKFAKNAINIPG